jgi:hypothetical protein
MEISALKAVGRRVRVNHALEHATITLLSSRLPRGIVLRGRSNRRGFYVIGNISADEIRSATLDAIRRLSSGESDLAIHPFCGTNLAVAGLLSGTASAIAVRMARKRENIPASILAALVALAVSQPLGLWAQRRITTESHVGHIRLISVTEKRFLGKKLHFVLTAQ